MGCTGFYPAVYRLKLAICLIQTPVTGHYPISGSGCIQISGSRLFVTGLSDIWSQVYGTTQDTKDHLILFEFSSTVYKNPGNNGSKQSPEAEF